MKPNRSHRRNNSNRHDRRCGEQPEPTQQECLGCAAGTISPLETGVMGLPIVSEQEVLMGMLTRTKMPFLFTPADDDENRTAVAIPLGEDGETTFDMVFCFDQYGRCIDTCLG